jgi:DNA-binding FadR family transcriptional regulator
MDTASGRPARQPDVTGRYPLRGPHGKVVHELGRRIVGGSLTPGSTISLADLQAEFDVSRTVIREALRVLGAKGLVEARQRRGTLVLPRERWKVLDEDVLRWQRDTGTEKNDAELVEKLSEVRMLVEPAAAALAAERATEADVQAVEAALGQIAVAVVARDKNLLVAADVAFHRAVAAATGNDLLAGMSNILLGALAEREEVAISALGYPRYVVPRHRAVLEAIRSKDPDLARTEMTKLVEVATRDERRAARKRRASS